MNIQTRKFNLIERLMLLQDEKILERIEKMLLSFKKQSKTRMHFSPMTLEEFYARNSQSQQEISEGKLLEQREVKKYFEQKGK